MQSNRTLKNVKTKEFVDDYIYRIDLDADYQREKIWSRKDQETLIESIVMDIDIPKLYLAKTVDSESFDFECIDGKQRMTALLGFFKPDPKDDSPLAVRVAGHKYTYKKLCKEHPNYAKQIEDFELTLVIYPKIEDEEFLREIFRRLQLGIRLNSGELLKSQTGSLRNFIFVEMGKDAPFLRHTKLSEKRFSRQFTLAQICIHSFSRNGTGDYVRARYDDLEEFFKEKYQIEANDQNLVRIRKVLKLMDRRFQAEAESISSRAVAVSAYLFAEELFLKGRASRVGQFAKFYSKLLREINEDLERLTKYESPRNRLVLEEFQKYISQASVEPYAVKRRHEFMRMAFTHYLKSKGEIVRK